MKIISCNKEIRGGIPCITGTRIPVDSIKMLKDRGFSVDEICTEFYPQLNELQVRAAINYGKN